MQVVQLQSGLCVCVCEINISKHISCTRNNRNLRGVSIATPKFNDISKLTWPKQYLFLLFCIQIQIL